MPKQRLMNVQALRFVAAALVVHTHSLDLSQRLGQPDRLSGFGNLENFGAFGVDLFFVISGFIIARTAIQSRPVSAATFAWRRVWRVAPIYFLMSAPWLFLAADWKTLTGSMLMATFLFWPAAGATFAFPALFVGWTLMFEMAFYTIVAASLQVSKRWFVLLLAVLYASFWTLRIATDAPAFQFLGNPIILEFMMGFAIAWIAPQISPRVGIRVLACGVAGVAANLVFGFGPIFDASVTATGEVAFTRVLRWGLPAALLALGVVAIDTPDRARPISRAKRTAVFLGDASYAIYLAHPYVHYWIERIFRDHQIVLPGLAITSLGIVTAIGGGVLVYRLIEQPLARFGARALQRPLATHRPLAADTRNVSARRRSETDLALFAARCRKILASDAWALTSSRGPSSTAPDRVSSRDPCSPRACRAPSCRARARSPAWPCRDR